MRITAREHPEAVRRYSHLKPAGGLRADRCSARCPGVASPCTLQRGHRGPHVAHGLLRRVIAVWDADASPHRQDAPAHHFDARPRRQDAPAHHIDASPRQDAPAHRRMSLKRGRRPAKKPIGLRQRTPVGIVEEARDLAARLLASWDQIAFVVLFIIFVKFAIDVLLTLH